MMVSKNLVIVQYIIEFRTTKFVKYTLSLSRNGNVDREKWFICRNIYVVIIQYFRYNSNNSTKNEFQEFTRITGMGIWWFCSFMNVVNKREIPEQIDKTILIYSHNSNEHLPKFHLPNGTFWKIFRFLEESAKSEIDIELPRRSIKLNHIEESFDKSIDLIFFAN